MELSEGQLPTHLKSALKYLKVPEVLTVTAINNLLGQIQERFGDTEWAEVMEKYPNGPYESANMPQQTPQPPPQPPPQQVTTTGLRPPQQAPQASQPQLPIEQVQWSDGSPMIPGQQNRGRTVPANEAGFPIAGDGSVDPGEVVAGGDAGDEDGVAQF